MFCKQYDKVISEKIFITLLFFIDIDNFHNIFDKYRNIDNSKMKQQQSDRNATINMVKELPKISTFCSTNEKFYTQCSKSAKKQSNSPVRMKQFLKLFKHSDSNTRILKISPYCNVILKNKIINALQSTKRGQRFYYPLRKVDKGKDQQKQNNHNKYGENQVTSMNSCSFSRDFSIVKIAKKGLSSFNQKVTKKIQSYIRYLHIQIQQQSMQIQVTEDVVDQNCCLSVPKIIQFVQTNYRQIGRSNKIFCLVGFSVIKLEKKKEERSHQKIRNVQEENKVNERKNLLQSSSYLLSIGKLNPKDKKYENCESITLKPIFPKRAKQFICKKQKIANNESKNEQMPILGEPQQRSIQKQKQKQGNERNVMKNVTLSDFDIIKCLGSGGFSTVFLVRGNFNAKYYAMKVIDKKFIMETERDGIVQNERFILETLSKKNTQSEQKGINFITELSFSFQTFHHFIFILEYCPGGELFNQLKKVRKMTEEQAKFYFLEILIAIDYIHSHNVIYRDLKPENLLIDADGHIKIADFGLSKPLQNFKNPSYSFCGSPQYMAPEMLTKSGHNHLLDYYCLGALLYELVIGVPPYYSLKQEQIYQSILTQQLQFPKHVPLSTQIMNLLLGLLKKDPKQRLGSLCGIKQIMCHPWFGRINKSKILSKQLKPPFIPDLNENNFDDEQIKANVSQILEKLKKDVRDKEFETHFSEQFMFINCKQKLDFLDKYSKSNHFEYSSKTSRKSHLPKSNSVPHTNRFASPYPYKSLIKEKDQLKHSRKLLVRNKENSLPDQINEKTKKMKSEKSKSKKKKCFQKKYLDKQNWL